MRPETIDYLIKIGQPASKPLMQALIVGNDSVRTFAAFALGRLRTSQALEPLIKSLKDENEDVRIWTAWALGEIADPRAAEPLRHALADESEFVRAAASSSLDRLLKLSTLDAFFISMDIESATHNYTTETRNANQDVVTSPSESESSYSTEIVPPEATTRVKENWIVCTPLPEGARSTEGGDCNIQTGPQTVEEAPEIIAHKPPSATTARHEWESGPLSTASIESILPQRDMTNPMTDDTYQEFPENLHKEFKSTMQMDARPESPATATDGSHSTLDTPQAPQRGEDLDKGEMLRSPQPIPSTQKEDSVAAVAEQSNHDPLSNTIQEKIAIATQGEMDYLLKEQSPATAHAPPTILEPLLIAFRDGDEDLREIVIHTLKDLHDDWIPALFVQGLQDENKEVRWWSVWTLGQFEGDAVILSLIQAMQDPDDEVRSLAGSTFSRIRKPSAIQAFIQAKCGADATPSSTGIGILIDTLHHENAKLRTWAAWALGAVQNVAAIDPLIEAMHDESRLVRIEAVHALEGYGESAVAPLIQALHTAERSVRVGIASCLLRIGAPSVNSLIVSMGDEEEKIQRLAAALLALLYESSVEPLIEGLANPVENIRVGAAYTLEKIGRPAVCPLIHALDSEQENLQRAAQDLLVRIGEPGVESLILSLADERENVRAGATRVLGEIKDARGIVPVIRMLRDSDERVRLDAAHALGQFGEPAVSPLRDALGSETQSQQRMADALLALIQEPAVEPLIRTISSGEGRERDTASALFALIFTHLFDTDSAVHRRNHAVSVVTPL